jgi:hypothetical protein
VRPRRPIKVVGLVLAFWIIGNALQVGLTRLLDGSGLLLEPTFVTITSQVAAWGLLFVIAVVFRERLDFWLRN